MKRSGPSSLSESFGERPERLTQGGGPNDSNQGEGAGPRWSPLLSFIIGACWGPWGVRQWAQMVHGLSSSTVEVNIDHYGFYAAIREYLW
eukprot:1817670-Pyramimonas_sp.AAC.1